MLSSLSRLLRDAARRFGGRTALIVDGRRFSFSKLEKLSGRFAHALVGLGVEPGDRVTLYGPNSWEWVVSYYGILKTGAVVNPINVMLTPEEVAYVVGDCGARAIVAAREQGLALLGSDAGFRARQIILFGDGLPDGALGFDALVAGSAPDFEPVDVAPDQPSTICYTSGTTGKPKGAMLSHRAVLMNVAMTALMHGRNASDVVVTALPCPHVYGNVVMNASIQTGMTLVLFSRFSETQILGAIRGHRATLFEGVPTMFMYLLAHPDLDRYDLSSLRCCTVGGQTMPVTKMQEVEERFGCPLIELWGMTEIAGLGTTHPHNGPRKLGSIGIPLPYVEARVADVEDPGRTLPIGEVGELLVRGPIVMQGYFGNPAATRETIEPDGWLHTGDLARVDQDGCIFIVDRKKDMILTAGYNVYPAEIERVVAEHPSVALVAVGKQADDLKGEIAKAYVVLKEGADADAETILAHCRAQLAAYKVPRAVQFVSDLPRTSSGKILRRELYTLDA